MLSLEYIATRAIGDAIGTKMQKGKRALLSHGAFVSVLTSPSFPGKSRVVCNFHAADDK